MNRYVTDDLTNFLFDVKGENGYGDDIASRNIQRGRDHGLPSYIKYRSFCNLPEDFSDIPKKNKKILRKLYKNLNQIDLWTGGLAERKAKKWFCGRATLPMFNM